MSQINTIFKIKPKQVISFNNSNYNPEAVEDFAVKKVVQSREIITGDHNANGLEPQVVNVIYGTSATPPDADTTTIGTLYIQYTV